jgi:hypothetical protein
MLASVLFGRFGKEDKLITPEHVIYPGEQKVKFFDALELDVRKKGGAA